MALPLAEPEPVAEATPLVVPSVTPVEVAQETTEADEKMIAICKEEFGDRLNHVPADTVIRFVRGYATEKTRRETTLERLQFYLEKYEEFDCEHILEEAWDLEDQCVNAWEWFLYGRDKQCHPVMWDRVGAVSQTTLKTCFVGKLETVGQRFRFRLMMRAARRKQQLSEETGMLIYKHILIFDVSNFGMSSLTGEVRGLIQQVIGREQHLFPETLYKMYIINASWSFRTIWKIIGLFIDALTYKKINVLGSSYLPELLKEVDSDQIPEMYGGTGKVPIVLGFDAETVASEGKEGERMQKKKKGVETSAAGGSVAATDEVEEKEDERAPESAEIPTADGPSTKILSVEVATEKVTAEAPVSTEKVTAEIPQDEDLPVYSSAVSAE